MAAPARSRARPPTAETRRSPRAILPQRVALKPSPVRRPGGPARPAPEPAPPRIRRRRAAAARPRFSWLGGRGVRPTLVLDRLLRGRVWVVLIAVLLTGIVFLNVALLEVNGSIARMDTRAADLARENSALRMRVARLGSSERIQREAAGRGFVAVAPGRVAYLDARPGDAAAAARALERWPKQQSPAKPATGGAESAEAARGETDTSATGAAAATAATGGSTSPRDSAASSNTEGASAGDSTAETETSDPWTGGAGTASP